MRSLSTGFVTACVLGLSASQVSAEAAEETDFPLQKNLALGITEYRLDHRTEVVGWRINAYWYLGHKDGKNGAGDEALSLIWQGERRQVSISTEGIRFTRRF